MQKRTIFHQDIVAWIIVTDEPPFPAFGVPSLVMDQPQMARTRLPTVG